MLITSIRNRLDIYILKAFDEVEGITRKYTVNGGELGHFLKFFKIDFSTIASKELSNKKYYNVH